MSVSATLPTMELYYQGVQTSFQPFILNVKNYDKTNTTEKKFYPKYYIYIF